MNKEYKLAIAILRAQPLHIGHLEVLKTAFNKVDNVLIFIGSANSPRTINNPFTYEERRLLINKIFYNEWIDGKAIILPLNDYIYDNVKWKKQIDDAINYYADTNHHIGLLSNKDICIVGGCKGEWYFDLFPEIAHEYPETTIAGLNATDIRDIYFTMWYEDANKKLEPLLPRETFEFLKKFRFTKWYGYIACELGKIKELNREYGKGPFLTSDNVITQGDKILLIKRKNHPGKGLFAIPGGFVESNETFEQAAYRELKEETNLSISLEEFKKYLVKTKIYDHPRRSIASRIVTMAHLIVLPEDLEVKFKAGDDAVECFWYQIKKLNEISSLFYDDHYSILNEILVLE